VDRAGTRQVEELLHRQAEDGGDVREDTDAG
jgi:hypothetical protein